MSVLQLTSPFRQEFLEAMSRVANTVSVVTTDGPAGRSGTTVSAMTSVSADGELPTLLICLNHGSSAAPAILRNGRLCVNVLRDDQSEISDSFAGRSTTGARDKFSCTDWVTMRNGTPRMGDPLVAFGCRIVSSDQVGTHHVLICAAEDIHIGRQGSALLHADRDYRSLAWTQPRAGAAGAAGARPS